MWTVKPILAAALLSMAACASPVVDETGRLDIRSVTVAEAPGVQSATAIGQPLEQATTATVVGVDPAGRAADLQITVNKLVYKNAALSLLVGSSNGLYTTVTVTDESGVPLKTFQYATLSKGAINGVIGAAMALSQDHAQVDRQLVETYAAELRMRIYGGPGHFQKLPAVAPAPAPQEVPAPAPAPAPAGVPVS